MIPNYEDFLTKSVIPILKSQESNYKVELSNLEAMLEAANSATLSNAKILSHMSANRL